MTKINLCIIIIILSLSFNSNLNSQILDSTTGWIKLTEGLDFPEGPAYDGNGSVYFSNCYGGWIGKYSAGKLDTFIQKSDKDLSIEKTNGLAIGPDGFLYGCDYGKGMIFRSDSDGSIEIVSDGYDGQKFNRPNDMVFDKDGNLFFTDPKSYGMDKPDGRIFYLNLDSREVKLLADSLAFPNGINISPLDNKLYVCESAQSRILRFDFSNGELTNKEVFAEIPGGDPDGIEFDIEGNLYAAHFGGGAVYVFSPVGKIIQKIATPGLKPTNLEFGGSDLKTLFLTEVVTNSLYKIEGKFSGSKLVRFVK